MIFVYKLDMIIIWLISMIDDLDVWTDKYWSVADGSVWLSNPPVGPNIQHPAEAASSPHFFLDSHRRQTASFSDLNLRLLRSLEPKGPILLSSSKCINPLLPERRVIPPLLMPIHLRIQL